MKLAEINDAMSEAFHAALLNPERVAPIFLDESVTLRTDIYTGPAGAGFQVVCVMHVGEESFMCIRQHGPEVWREKSWDLAGMLAALEKGYSLQISRGITVQGVTLRAEEGDRATFSQLMTLLREAEELQPDEVSKAAYRSSEVTITDIQGAPHHLAIDKVRSILVEYGSRLNAQWAEAAIARAEIVSMGLMDHE